MKTTFALFVARAGIVLVASVMLAACSSPEEKAQGYLEQARKLYEAGDTVRAEVELRNALQVQPRNAQALYLLALIDERKEEYPKVLGSLLMAVEADPKFVDARVKLGNYYAVGNKVAETREQADAAMALAPDSASVRVLNARAYFIAGDYAKALEEVQAALRIDAKRTDAPTLAATIHVNEGRPDEAVATLDAAIAIADRDAAEGLRRARVTLLKQLQRFAEAEQELLTLIADYPGNTEYELALARFYVQQNRSAEAEQRLKSLIGREPANADLRVQYAGLLAAQNRTAEATGSLEQAVKENPASTSLKFALASAYESLDRGDEARALYEALAVAGPTSDDGLRARNRVIALTMPRDEKKARELIAGLLADVPNNAEALRYRAAYSITDRKYDEAIADLRSSLVREPQSQIALLMLARTYVLSGDAALAEDTYRKLLAIDPALVPARNEMAAVIGGRGDMEQAEKLLRESLQIRPGDADSARRLVSALLAGGDYKAAEEQARQALQAGDSSGVAEYQLALALQAQQQTGQAIAAYKAALERSPMAGEPLAGLVTLLVKSGRASEAQAYLESHLRAHAEDVNAQVLLGTVYRDSGNVELARSTFRKVIAGRPEAMGAYIGLASTFPPGSADYLAVLQEAHRKNPADAQAGFGLGVAYEKRKEFEKAIAAYEETIRAGGSSEFLVSNLALLLLDARSDKASHARALDLVSGFAQSAVHPYQLGVLGWAYYRNGRYADAVRHLERARAASPTDNPQIRYYLGMAYLRNDNPVGAREELTQAVKLAESGGSGFAGLDEARAALKSLP